MPSRGRGSWQGRRSNRNHGDNPTRLRGLFIQNIWHCDCHPRLPAAHFQVKKECPNKGRWFYTCQNTSDETGGCGFFLWNDDAKIREESAVLNNSRSEVHQTDNARSAPGLIASAFQNCAQDESGRRQPSLEPDDRPATLRHSDPSNPDHDMPNDGEQVVADVEAITSRIPEPVTPGKRKFSEMNGAGGLPTPKTGGNIFTTPTRTASISADFLDMVSPATTPTPARFKDAAGAAGHLNGLYNDVMGVLNAKKVHLAPEALSEVREVCSRFSRRAYGVEKGKEITQLALRARDAKIEELKRRIGTLEAELETERAVVRHLRWETEAQEGE